MASANDKIALKGSEREALPQATVLGAANPQDRIEVTVILHPRSSSSVNATSQAQAISPEQSGNQLPTPLLRERLD